MKLNQEIVEAMRQIQSICHYISNPDKLLLLPHNEMSPRPVVSTFSVVYRDQCLQIIVVNDP